MACRRGRGVEVGAGVTSRATQGPRHVLRPLREGKVTVAPHLVGPSHRAAHGAGVTPHHVRLIGVPPTKAPRCGATGDPRTASTLPRSHTSPGAGAPPALGATHGSGRILLENTRKKVITIENSDESVLGLMSEQAIAMSGTILGTAGTGGEGWGPRRTVLWPSVWTPQLLALGRDSFWI